MAKVTLDAQGRLVVPKEHRRRLGVTDGGELEMIPTPEGLVLEARHRVRIEQDEDGLPSAVVEGLGEVSNDEALAAIHDQRDGRLR